MSLSLKQAPLSCPGHTRPVVDISFSGETEAGSFFISAAKDGKAILRRGDTGDWIGTFVGHKGAVWSCVLDSCANKAATGAADFSAKVWDAVTGHELLSINQDHIVRCVDLSKTDSSAHLLTANNWKKISVYDLTAAEIPLVVLEGHTQIIRRLLWCNEDRHALSISEDKSIRLWDLGQPGNKPVVASSLWIKDMPEPITDVQLYFPSAQPTSKPINAVLTCGRTIHLYNLDWRFMSLSSVQPLDSINSFTMPCPMNTASLHPTENIIVCGGDDHLVYRIDSTSGEILEACKGHFGPIHCVRFAPHGQLFTSGSEDGTVRLWQTNPGSEFGLWKLSSPDEEVASLPEPLNDPDQLEILNMNLIKSA